MAKGGYRKPGNPAPVSGPGKLSRRTDGGPTQAGRYMAGGKYGEGKQLMEQQQSAPMSGGPEKPQAPKLTPITSFSSPTARPDEPVTAGAPVGAGPGPEVLAMNRSDVTLSQVMGKIARFDTTGQLGEFYDYLLNKGL